MSIRSKYSLNGVYKCENFAEHLEDDDFTEFPIGRALGRDGWKIRLRKVVENGKSLVFPSIFHNLLPLKMKVRGYFNILKKDGSSSFKTEYCDLFLESYEVCTGPDMEIEELLDEENGYLDDGALTVEYGFQVDSEEGYSGIWLFNFFDSFFDSKDKDIAFEFDFEKEESVFGHLQIVQLHSPEVLESCDWAQVPNCFYQEEVDCLLQVAHGVQLQLTVAEYEETIITAFRFGFSNAVRYCEGKLIQVEEKLNLELKNFKFSINYNMRCYLNHLLEQIKSTKQLVDILKELDLEQMSSESMKTFVGKYLDLIE